jgi:ABC-type transport system involved in cytochrome bd biosynthesis fused ATPase/permease subunit
VTAGIFAGEYDEQATNSMHAVYEDNSQVQLHNEFRELRQQRWYIRQDIAKLYQFQNTIKLTLTDLFPGGSRDDIVEFLMRFSTPLANKCPSTLTVPFSTTARGLSGGENQLLALASNIWLGMRSNTWLWIFDEPESAIDKVRAPKIMEYIVSLGRTVVLITHSDEIKRAMKDHVVQTLKFGELQDGVIRFCVV